MKMQDHFGTVFDMDCKDEMRITVIATGIQDGNMPVERSGKVTAITPASVRQGEESGRFIQQPRSRKISANESTDLSVPAYLRAKSRSGHRGSSA